MALVNEFQCFPLAIQQAILYITHERITRTYSINDYLKEYKEKTKTLLKSEIFQGIDNECAKTTFTTWRITIDKIENKENGVLALRILDIIAYLRNVSKIGEK